MNPLRALLRRRKARWPRPEDFDRMTPQEFDAYVERIGLDAQIKAALAESDPRDAHFDLEVDPRTVDPS